MRVDVAYPLMDGRHDVHKALVIAGAEPLSGKIAAHAYTDGGVVREYAVENRKAWLDFEDQPPGNEKHRARARKILQPTENGFKEVWRSMLVATISLHTMYSDAKDYRRVSRGRVLAELLRHAPFSPINSFGLSLNNT